MNGDERPTRTNQPMRMAVLVVAGVVAANVAGALLFERDTGLGADDLYAVLAGVALAAIAEFGIFRRRHR